MNSTPLMNETEVVLFCPRCAYDLRGTASDRCPECGDALDFAALSEPQIPWVHRDRHGVIAAFIATAWMVISRPRRLCEEVHRPVCERQARRFRRCVAWYAFLSWAVLIMSMFHRSGGSIYEWPGVPALLFYAFGSMYLSTGAPAHAFESRSAPPLIQARSGALSYYASAGLILLPVAFAIAWVLGVYAPRFRRAEGAMLTLAVLVALGPFMLWMHRLVQLARSTLRLHGGQLNWWAFKLLVLWAAAATLPLLGLAAISYTWLAVWSLL